VLWGLGVHPGQVSHDPPCTLDVLKWTPFILLNIIPLPAYEVLKFPSEDLAVQDLFHFVLVSGGTLCYSLLGGLGTEGVTH